MEEMVANKNRLCVKGRFGFDYIHNPERLKVPLIRKSNKPKNPNEKLDPLNPFTHFRGHPGTAIWTRLQES